MNWVVGGAVGVGITTGVGVNSSHRVTESPTSIMIASGLQRHETFFIMRFERFDISAMLAYS